MTTHDQPPAVAVLGLGAMGGRAAARLAQTNPVSGFDPLPEAQQRAHANGVSVAATAAAAVASADVVLLSLPTPEHVVAAVDDVGRGWASKLVADLSTVGPADARAAAERLGRFGARYVDAPVLGRPDACGRWVLPAGGAAADVDTLDRVATGTIARAVRRVGEIGAGSTLKIANNLMFAAINAATAEAIDLVEAAGMDAEIFVEVVSGSGAATVSPLFTDVAPRMVSRSYEPTFRLELLAKDLGLAHRLARQLGRDAPVSGVVLELLRSGLAAGLGPADTAALIEVYRSS